VRRFIGDIIYVIGSTLPSVYLVRHGETAWTASGQHTGLSDIPLTPRGEDEARALASPLRRLHFSDVFTSPLQRAARTCALAGFGDVARTDADLREWDYGDYEGRRTSEIRAERPGWDLFADGCPNGERVADVGVRAGRVIDRVRACAGNVLLFAHRDIFRVMTARWIDLRPNEGRRLYLDTGALSVLGYHHSVHEPVIRLWNGTSGDLRP
jgi:probable phosphoglycerate mutase